MLKLQRVKVTESKQYLGRRPEPFHMEGNPAVAVSVSEPEALPYNETSKDHSRVHLQVSHPICEGCVMIALT